MGYKKKWAENSDKYSTINHTETNVTQEVCNRENLHCK